MSTPDAHTENVLTAVHDDIIDVAIGHTHWRIRFRLTPAALTLRDAKTGEPLCCAPLTHVGIRYRNGTYDPSGAKQDALLAAYVIAWIKLLRRH